MRCGTRSPPQVRWAGPGRADPAASGWVRAAAGLLPHHPQTPGPHPWRQSPARCPAAPGPGRLRGLRWAPGHGPWPVQTRRSPPLRRSRAPWPAAPGLMASPGRAPAQWGPGSGQCRPEARPARARCPPPGWAQPAHREQPARCLHPCRCPLLAPHPPLRWARRPPAPFAAYRGPRADPARCGPALRARPAEYARRPTAWRRPRCGKYRGSRSIGVAHQYLQPSGQARLALRHSVPGAAHRPICARSASC